MLILQAAKQQPATNHLQATSTCVQTTTACKWVVAGCCFAACKVSIACENTQTTNNTLMAVYLMGTAPIVKQHAHGNCLQATAKVLQLQKAPASTCPQNQMHPDHS